MRNEILIPSAIFPNIYFLGPMGDPDPSNFIRQETNQIPFKQSVVDLSSWNTKTLFRNWPKMPKGWRNWFYRVSEKKGGDQELYDLNQCLTLSLSGMERNDSLLISASYFWSNALNAFVFGHDLSFCIWSCWPALELLDQCSLTSTWVLALRN